MWCTKCLRRCHGVRADMGVGDLDYCGHSISTTEWVWLSDCCGAVCVDEEPDPVEESEDADR